jgi:hypothetical protein
LIVWLLVGVIGVVTGAVSRQLGIIAFYGVVFGVGLGCSWLATSLWERGAPKRDVEAADRRASREAGRAAEAVRREESERLRNLEAAAKVEAQKHAVAERAEAETLAANERSANEARAAGERAEVARRAAATVTLTAQEARLVDADRLRQDLAMGGQVPMADRGGIVLDHAESLVVRSPATVWECRGQAVQYRQGGALFFGSPLFLVGSLAASVAISAAARSRAQKASATQWRHVDTGTVLLTTKRLAIMGTAGWRDIPFDSIRSAECEVDALALHVSGAPPLRIVTDTPERLYILLNQVAWGRVPDTQLPSELVTRLARAEVVLVDGPESHLLEARP